MRFTTITLLAALFFFAGCANSNNTDNSGEGDSMGQFADDQEFKDAHDKPDSLAFQGTGTMVEFPTADGKPGKAYALMTEDNTTDYLFVIHEWWGLNDYVKKEAERLHQELGVNVMALDLYDGKVTDNPDQAGAYMQAVQQARLEAIVKGALTKVGPDAKIGTIGWCFGGGWSLRTSILAADQGIGCVIYYGMPVEKAAELAPLKADILGIFATKDQWINEDLISQFEKLTAATGKDFEIHWFDADHAFANPSNPNFNEEAADNANALAYEFLNERF